MIDKPDRKNKGILISGVEIEVENVGKIKPLTIKEIFIVGEDEYNKYLSALLIDQDDLEDSSAIDTSKIKPFDILAVNCYHKKSFRDVVEKALSVFLNEKVTFIPEFLVFYVGEKEEHRLIHKENYDEIINIIKLHNRIKDKESKNKNKMSKKAQMLAKKRKIGRSLIAKAKGESDVTLADLVSNMGVFTSNIETGLNMTMYQFYDQYQKFMSRESYTSNFDTFLAGADPKKLDLEKHWTFPKIKNKQEGGI